MWFFVLLPIQLKISLLPAPSSTTSLSAFGPVRLRIPLLGCLRLFFVHFCICVRLDLAKLVKAFLCLRTRFYVLCLKSYKVNGEFIGVASRHKQRALTLSYWNEALIATVDFEQIAVNLIKIKFQRA